MKDKAAFSLFVYSTIIDVAEVIVVASGVASRFPVQDKNVRNLITPLGDTDRDYKGVLMPCPTTGF